MRTTVLQATVVFPTIYISCLFLPTLIYSLYIHFSRFGLAAPLRIIKNPVVFVFQLMTSFSFCEEPRKGRFIEEIELKYQFNSRIRR